MGRVKKNGISHLSYHGKFHFTLPSGGYPYVCGQNKCRLTKDTGLAAHYLQRHSCHGTHGSCGCHISLKNLWNEENIRNDNELFNGWI